MSAHRNPVPSDFPSTITLSISHAPNSPSTPAPNILILLHGLGDTHLALRSLGTSMSLPETTCISIRAPTPLPFDLGHSSPNAQAGAFHWGDDIVFDESGIEVEGCGYGKAVTLLKEVLDVLREKCGYGLRDVVVMGLGQGGGVALALAKALAEEANGADQMGGVISLGGALPDDYRQKEGKAKSKTPVLVCHGRSQSAVTVSKVKRVKDAFEYTQVVEWKRPGDGMARSREEMLPVMQFFGRRLRSRTGVPEGAVEVG